MKHQKTVISVLEPNVLLSKVLFYLTNRPKTKYFQFTMEKD